MLYLLKKEKRFIDQQFCMSLWLEMDEETTEINEDIIYIEEAETFDCIHVNLEICFRGSGHQ